MAKEYRRTDPLFLQYIWNSIDELYGKGVTTNQANLCSTIEATYQVTNCATTFAAELRNALRDNCLVQESDKYFRVDVAELVGLQGGAGDHDWYCFECHKGGSVVHCSTPGCPRVYHPNCSQKRAHCSLCTRAVMTVISQSDLHKLLRSLTDRFRQKKAWTDLAVVGYVTDTARNAFLMHTIMNTQLILDKVQSGAYCTLDELMVDFDIMLHNVHIIYRPGDGMIQSARALRHDLESELREASYCLDCYMRSRKGNKSDPGWITRPCRQPHRAIWDYRNASTFWPCKVLHETEEGYEVVCFGGRHERTFVSKERGIDIDFNPEELGLRKSEAMKKALDEARQYLDNQKTATLSSRAESHSEAEEKEELVPAIRGQRSSGSLTARRGRKRKIDVGAKEEAADQVKKKSRLTADPTVTSTTITIPQPAMQRKKRGRPPKVPGSVAAVSGVVGQSNGSLGSVPSVQALPESTDLHPVRHHSPQQRDRHRPNNHHHQHRRHHVDLSSTEDEEDGDVTNSNHQSSPRSRSLSASSTSSSSSSSSSSESAISGEEGDPFPHTADLSRHHPGGQDTAVPHKSRRLSGSSSSSSSTRSSVSSSGSESSAFSMGRSKLLGSGVQDRLGTIGSGGTTERGRRGHLPAGKEAPSSTVCNPSGRQSGGKLSMTTTGSTVATTAVKITSPGALSTSGLGSSLPDHRLTDEERSPALSSSAASSAGAVGRDGRQRRGRGRGGRGPMGGSGATGRPLLLQQREPSPQQPPANLYSAEDLELRLSDERHRWERQLAQKNTEFDRERAELQTKIRDLEVTLTEREAQHQAERVREADERRTEFQAKLAKVERDLKSRSWCRNCYNEAKYHCCMGVYYCSQKCQHRHWKAEHMNICQRRTSGDYTQQNACNQRLTNSHYD